MDVTFIVEDGSGVAGATSYATLSDLKQYWYDHEYDYGDLTDDAIRRLLNKSTKYIDDNYRGGFSGYRQYDDQMLEWPRYGAYYLRSYDIRENTIPQEVKNAVYEASYLQKSGVDLTATISKAGKITKTSVKVDVIEESIEYESGSSLYSDIYTIIDDTLSRITGGVSDRFVLRAIRVGGESP